MFGVYVRSILVVASALCFIGAREAAAQESDPLVFALSGHHAVPDIETLSRIAGGDDALIARLLVLRRSEGLPFVAVRAEKILLEFADRGDVQTALIEDVRDPRTKGLARTIATGVDKVPDPDVRSKLADGIVTRSKSDSEFEGYRKALSQSPNPEVREAASK